MKTLRNNLPLVLLAALTLAVMSSLSTVANADEAPRWTVKAGLALVDTSKPFSIDKPSGGQITAGGNAELGATVGIEYRMTPRIGFELATAYSKSPDVNDSVAANGDELGEGPSFQPLIAGANFHLASTENFSFFAGPRVAFVNFGDFELKVDGVQRRYEVDSEFAWGASAGLNYRFTDSPWVLVAEATYLDADMTIKERGGDGNFNNEFDPLMVNFGIKYNF